MNRGNKKRLDDITAGRNIPPSFQLLPWQEKGSTPLSITSLNIDNEFPQSITVFFYNFSVYIHTLTLLIENSKTPEQLNVSNCALV